MAKRRANGEGAYDPGATVTAVDAASMLMRALGCFQYANDVADGFELSAVLPGARDPPAPRG